MARHLFPFLLQGILFAVIGLTALPVNAQETEEDRILQQVMQLMSRMQAAASNNQDPTPYVRELIQLYGRMERSATDPIVRDSYRQMRQSMEEMLNDSADSNPQTSRTSPAPKTTRGAAIGAAVGAGIGAGPRRADELLQQEPSRSTTGRSSREQSGSAKERALRQLREGQSGGATGGQVESPRAPAVGQLPGTQGEDIPGVLGDRYQTPKGRGIERILQGQDESPEGRRLRLILEGQDETPGGRTIRRVLEGQDETPEGRRIRRILEGEDETPEGRRIRRILAGEDETPEGRRIRRILDGEDETPQGRSLRRILEGQDETPKGRAIRRVLEGQDRPPDGTGTQYRMECGNETAEVRRILIALEGEDYCKKRAQQQSISASPVVQEQVSQTDPRQPESQKIDEDIRRMNDYVWSDRGTQEQQKRQEQTSPGRGCIQYNEKGGCVEGVR